MRPAVGLACLQESTADTWAVGPLAAVVALFAEPVVGASGVSREDILGRVAGFVVPAVAPCLALLERAAVPSASVVALAAVSVAATGRIEVVVLVLEVAGAETAVAEPEGTRLAREADRKDSLLGLGWV